MSEFAVRDSSTSSGHLAPDGVTVIDDILPRNPSRPPVRRTGAWEEVYKEVQIIAPIGRNAGSVIKTGDGYAIRLVATVIGCCRRHTPRSTGLEAQAPQSTAAGKCHVTQRSTKRIAASEAWPLLVAARECGDATLIEKAKDILQSIPTLG